MVAYLLARRDFDYNMGLMGASKKGDQELVELMENLDAHDVTRSLIHAAKGGHMDVFLHLVNKGGTDFPSAFTSAAIKGQLLIMKKIIELTDVSAVYPEALRLAVEKGHLSVMKFLLTKFVPVIDYPIGTNGLNSLEIIETILPYINPGTYQDMLYEAAVRGQLLVVQKLVSLGADPLTEIIQEEVFTSWMINIMIELIRRGADYTTYKVDSQLLPYLQKF